MSRVFIVHETRLKRDIVVKVLPPEMADGVSIERFEREIALAARLQHPHIVPLARDGRDGTLSYYTMPYVEGETLRERLTRVGELPIAEAVRLLRDVATGARLRARARARAPRHQAGERAVVGRHCARRRLRHREGAHRVGAQRRDGEALTPASAC